MASQKTGSTEAVQEITDRGAGNAVEDRATSQKKETPLDNFRRPDDFDGRHTQMHDARIPQYTRHLLSAGYSGNQGRPKF